MLDLVHIMCFKVFGISNAEIFDIFAKKEIIIFSMKYCQILVIDS